jgi:hypothetical protein
MPKVVKKILEFILAKSKESKTHRKTEEGVIVGKNFKIRTSNEIILLKNYHELMKENYPEYFI